MNIIIPATVIAGYEFQADPVTDLIKVTKDRLNLLGGPSASFVIPNGGLLEPEIIVGGDGINDVNITVQVKDFLGNNFASKVSFNAWLSSIAGGTQLTAGVVGSKSVLSGVVVKEYDPHQDLHVITDSSGEVSITYTSATDQTAYFNVELNNILYSSQPMIWAH